MPQDVDVYGIVGGDEAFGELVEAFYRGVETDVTLRALYPADLEPGKKHLAWFLIQRFGGPNYFNERRGAPMLRMRHRAFPIDIAARDAWVRHMMAAVDETAQFDSVRDVMRQYFEDAATFLINREDTAPGKTVLKQL